MLDQPNQSDTQEAAVFLLRHGESEANEKGFIASLLNGAGGTVGLTPHGRDQVKPAAAEICEQLRMRNNPKCIVVASPFKRTIETAQELIKALPSPVVFLIDARFGERSFGNLEGQGAQNYQEVWARDTNGLDVSNWKGWAVEPLEDVQRRSQAGLADISKAYPGAVVVIVTHGDVASNIMATARGLPVRAHRDVYLPNAGVARVSSPQNPGPT